MELAARTSRPAVAVPNQGDEILQNAINSFRQVLTPEQLAEFNCIQSLPDTDAVLVFTAELDLRRQGQKGKSIASRLAPVLQAVHSFTGVIDTLVSSNPTVAALVWGSVKITIQIILNAASYYEAFAELFVKLTTVCPRFEQYQALFPTSTRLQVALCNFNASIIRCCQRVVQMPKSSSGWTSPLNPLSSSFWQSFQQSFEPNLKELRDYSENVKEEIRLAQTESEHRNREIQRVERAGAEKLRRSLSRFMPHTRAQLDEMRRSQLIRDKEVERERKQKLLDSLSSHDYMKPFKQARQKRYPQSATWIFDTNEFRSWAEGQGSPLLWCCGKMGSGKTILTASVIDFLLTGKTKNKGKVMFFFSRFDESESIGAESILRAVARQIINIRDISDDTEVSLEDIHTQKGDVLNKLSQLLGLLLGRNQQTAWVVIDGIDEWPRDERHKLVKALSSILAPGPDVRIFATSRDHPDSMTTKAFPGLHQVSMNCSKAQEGMARLVDQAVQRCIDAEELLVKDKRLIADIQTSLSENADGMILWVTLVLKDLCMQPNNERIRDAISLRNLPKSLTDVFNRALKRIISQGKEGITQAILPWIVATKQPLSLPQLEECCLIRVLQEYSIRDRYVNGIHLIDSWFQGLVEVDHETKTVHFIHSSVQSFFLTTTSNPALGGFYVNMEEADRHIGEVIVTYLNFNDFKKTLAQRRPALPPISPEAIYKQVLNNELGWRKFLHLGRGSRSAYIDETVTTCTRAARATFQETTEMEHPFLLYASTYWLSHSVNFDPKDCQVWHLWKDLLINGTSPLSTGPHGPIDEALVRWATFTRHFPLLYAVGTTKELLDQFQTAIVDCTMEVHGHEEVEDLMVFMRKTKTLDSEFFAKDAELCCFAAECGFIRLLKELITTGVDVNGSESGRPLIEAILSGQVGTIEFLLASGANPNLSTDSYRNALEPAVRLYGSEGFQVCQMLIKAGAVLGDEFTSEKRLSALLRACDRDDREMATFFLSAGADPNGCLGSFSALERCLAVDNFQMIRVLLDFGLNVNRENLTRVCNCKHPRSDIIELFLNAGAEFHEDQGFDMLMLAVQSKNNALVELLLKKGVGVNGNPNKEYGNPMQVAARGGSFEIMYILLDAGATVVDADDLMSQLPPYLQYGEQYEEISRRLHI